MHILWLLYQIEQNQFLECGWHFPLAFLFSIFVIFLVFLVTFGFLNHFAVHFGPFWSNLENAILSFVFWFLFIHSSSIILNLNILILWNIFLKTFWFHCWFHFWIPLWKHLWFQFLYRFSYIERSSFCSNFGSIFSSNFGVQLWYKFLFHF